MEGTVHIIHKLNNEWIFLTYEKVGKDLIPKRFPFICNDEFFEDGQSLIGEIVSKEGVEYIKKKV